MTSKLLPVIERGLRPKGSEAYETKREKVLREFSDSVPDELRLPRDIINNPPLDVSEIPRTCGLLNKQELDITENYDATGLAQAIADRTLTSVEVTTAFCKRAIIAHQLTCCLTQFFMDKALLRAKRLDDHLARTGKVVGPLHGVPISIKDHIPLAGHTSGISFLASVDLDKEDCVLTRLLRDMGALFYVKTNQPQGVMHLESDSFMWRTLNPYNINLSAGGSSGGEAALIALKGSPLGVGSDIGGSIRGPAAFCNIYGYKPTSYLMPTKGCIRLGFAGELNILAATGPMCRSMRDLELFCSSMFALRPNLYEARLVPLPWTGLATPVKKPLKIGIMRHDGAIQPQPPVARVLAWAVARLQQYLVQRPSRADTLPFQIRPYVAYKADTAVREMHRMYWPDAVQHTLDAIESTGESIHPLTDYVLSLAEVSEQNASDVLQMRLLRDKFRDDFTEDFNNQDVDVILCPAFVGPACAHDTAFFWNYTALWNFVDWPGVVVPTPIKVLPGETYTDAHTNAEPYPERAEWNSGMADHLEEIDTHLPNNEKSRRVKELWSQTNFIDAPVALQLVARKYADNELFGALAMLKDALELP